jgi:molybdate transport system substrate-binding protein
MFTQLFRRAAVLLVILLTFAAPALVVAACGGERPQPQGGVIAVAAAADLKFALDDVIAEFRRGNPNVRVRVTYGSSGNFHAQLVQRAPFDLYLSADIDYPKQLIAAGAADAGELFEYSIGRIVIWVPADSPIDVQALKHEAVLHPSVRRFAIANPAHAPYGRAAEAALKDLGVYEAVKDKLVLGENIAQAAQFMETGAADAGVIALSLALAPQMKDKGRYWEIPVRHFPRMLQGGVIPGHARNPQGAAELRDFLTGGRGRDILRRYGFYMPGG